MSFSPKIEKLLLITGPTRERIDSVRYISNFSSGKMGLAIINEALKNNIEIKVVSGPVAFKYPDECEVLNVESADEMKRASLALISSVDCVINCAAICDFKPKFTFDRKLKKTSDESSLKSIELVKNDDILQEICERKTCDQVVVGFCAETENLLENAKAKLLDKGCDIIVANDVSENQAFGKDESRGFIVYEQGLVEFDCSKQILAKKILKIAEEAILKKSN